MIHLFVYGTLKPGERNYRLCAKFVSEYCPAIARGLLYALPLGYPAISIGQGSVHGYVLSFASSDLLHTLDQYEQHDPLEFVRWAPYQSLKHNQYRRQEITVRLRHSKLTRVWAYTMTTEQINRLGGQLIKDGQWTPRKQIVSFNK